MTYGIPPTNQHLARQRDYAVRRAGRVRAALVGGATAASVGIAGVLGLQALTAAQTSSTASQAPAKAAHSGSNSGIVHQLKSFGSGQTVSNGNGGGTVATTKGS